jgi:Nickel responsive protein SCO4226-like
MLMPKFIIERNYAKQLELSDAGAANIKRINDDEEVRWIISFLSADKRKTYCLYEANDAEAIKRAAQRAGLPADVITSVDEVDPAMFG